MARSQKHLHPWEQVDRDFSDLSTEVVHEIDVEREAIPIIFVPGIMGSRLQRKGDFTDEESKAGCPHKRWDPGNKLFMAYSYLGAPAWWRKLMLVGERFSSGYLEVIHNDPPTDGFEGLMNDYHEQFLTPRLRGADWGPLQRYFDLPVYGCGYNWTGTVQNAGVALAKRITEIKNEARKVTGVCDKVIVVTHSMGGIVSRWASKHAGAEGDILGIIHSAQPVTGSPAAYWRMKAGFEGASDVAGTALASVLGNSAVRVTPLLANIPGGLSLLPNKQHRNNDGKTAWLTITQDGQPINVNGKPFNKPTPKDPDDPTSSGNPYDEIYRVKAVVSPDNDNSPSGNAYWGLVDPDLLDPLNFSAPAAPGGLNEAANDASSPWGQYLKVLKMAEDLHDNLGSDTELQHHDPTFCNHGEGFLSPNVVELRIEEKPWHTFRSYPRHGFRGFFRDANGKKMMAILQDHTGAGDGTVPQFSAKALDKYCVLDPKPPNPPPKFEHQDAYKNADVQNFTIRCIVSLCEQHFKNKHG